MIHALGTNGKTTACLWVGGTTDVLKKLGEQYTLNATALGEVGSSISFLKRKLVRLPCGLALVPGTCEQGDPDV